MMIFSRRTIRIMREGSMLLRKRHDEDLILFLRVIIEDEFFEEFELIFEGFEASIWAHRFKFPSL